MEFIVMVSGNVGHPLTIDPSVWIFDDRKVDLQTVFEEQIDGEDELTAYKKAISAQWDKELIEGNEPPTPPNQTKSLSKKQELLTKSFGMPFAPFLKNAKPTETATELIVETSSGEEWRFPLKDAYSFILGFSDKGHPLRETGPVHVYLGDGSNKENPIINVKQFVIK